MLDVLERLLDRGVVFEAPARAVLPELDIAGGAVALAAASVDGPAPAADGWAALEAAAAADDEARRAPARAEAPPTTDEVRRSGEHAALKRQFERLNA
jgi:hypothetical protein